MDHTFLSSKSFVSILIILAVPTIIIVGTAFFSNDLISNQTYFSLSGFDELLTTLRITELLRITGRAFFVCIIATFLSFLISYILVQYTSKFFQSFFFILITLPFLANESVRVFSWQYVLSRNGVFNNILTSIIGHETILFDGSNSMNIYLVMIIGCIPFGIFINSASLHTIPNIYWKTSNDLNIQSLSRLFKIALPLSKFAIITSIIVIFFISFSLSAEVNFLGGDSKISTRNLMLSLMSANKFQAIFSLGFIIVVFLLFVAFLYKLFVYNKSK